MWSFSSKNVSYKSSKLYALFFEINFLKFKLYGPDTSTQYNKIGLTDASNILNCKEEKYVNTEIVSLS